MLRLPEPGTFETQVSTVAVLRFGGLDAIFLRGCQQRELTSREQLPEVSIEGHEVFTPMRNGCSKMPGAGQR
jgi:hypothetical protein